MANKKISALTSATTPLAGTETLPVVQSGATVKATIANIVGAGTSPGSFTTVAATGDATITKVNPTVLLQGTEASAKTVALIEAAGVFKIGQSGVADWATFSSSSLALAGGLSTAGTIVSGGTVSLPTVSQYRFDTAANYFFITQTASGVAGSLKISQDSVRDMMVISSAGDITVSSGNLIQGTAAKGINFTANTPAAGKTSQLLNWYEEGTWTPGQGANLTVVGAFSSAGKYTRIGRQVTVYGSLTGATSVAITGGISEMFTGLPFAPADGTSFVITNSNYSAGGFGRTAGTAGYCITTFAAIGTLYFTITYQMA